MRSADLLRRAATRLRESVDRLPEPWHSYPWRIVQTDTESLDGIAACEHESDDHALPYSAGDCCWSSESMGHQSVAALAALMGPPVALVLAALLEDAADDLAQDGGVVQVSSQSLALSVADAILRSET